MGEELTYWLRISAKYLTGHYVENTGNTTLRYLEIFNTGVWLVKWCMWTELWTDHYEDISLNQACAVLSFAD